jgi:phenylacetate-CoA ligase
MLYLKNSAKYGFRYFVRENSFVQQRYADRIKNNVHRSQLEENKNTAKLLIRTLRCAVDSIPFYRDFADLIASIDRSNIFEKIRDLPVIKKNDLLDSKNEFYPNNGQPGITWSVGSTSGTTGTPLSVFRSFSSILYESAFIRRHWRLSGFRPRDRRATFRGDKVVPVDRTRPPFWFYNFFDNQLILSSRHLRDDFMFSIVEKLQKFSPSMLEAYPSTAYELAAFIDRKNLKLTIPFVYTGSEFLYEHQREQIEKSLNAQVMDFYGMAERVAFASECRRGKMHLNTDYSYVELLDDEDKRTEGLGYVTGTTFHNLAMPLVRYQLSDLVMMNDRPCGCGCGFPVIDSIAGKIEDRLFGIHGEPISPSVVTFAFKGVGRIRKSQVAQVGKGRWEVRIVPGDGFSGEVGEQVVDNIRKMVDSEIRVTIRIVDEISRTSAGKFQWVVNEWNRSGSADQ